MTDSRGGSPATKLIYTVLGSVLVAALVGTSSPWWWNEFFGDGTDSVATTTFPATTAAPAGDAGGGGGGGTTQTTATTAAPDPGTGEVAVSGCTATIENPLVSIRVEPDTFSQEVRRVPVGTHPVLEWKMVPFVGVDSRWLKLQVEADQGWIEDNTILVASTSDECDF
jgi:hypothetical protein